MGRKNSVAGERVFTLELNSRSYLKDVSVPRGPQRVTIEGTIGELWCAEFVDGSVLELTGTGGVLRVDLSNEDLATGAIGKGRKCSSSLDGGKNS